MELTETTIPKTLHIGDELGKRETGAF